MSFRSASDRAPRASASSTSVPVPARNTVTKRNGPMTVLPNTGSGPSTKSNAQMERTIV